MKKLWVDVHLKTSHTILTKDTKVQPSFGVLPHINNFLLLKNYRHLFGEKKIDKYVDTIV